jgi:glucokinase
MSIMEKHFLESNLVAGIDIGGSHITAGLINMATRSVVNDSIIRTPVNPHAAAEEIFTVWCNVIKQVWAAAGIKATPLGFAMPGPFDYANGICLIKGFDKYEALYEMDVREALATRLQIQGHNIRFRNDAEAFLEGELFCGAAVGYKHAIGITLGTGLGSARSNNGICADAELSVLPYLGEKIEAFVSTRGIIRIYRELTGNTLKDAKAIAALYPTDANAEKAFNIFSEHLSWFLEHFIKKENPEILVIGGNIANSWELFIEPVRARLISSLGRLPVIVKATLGENAGLIGGACCFHKQPVQAGVYDK